MNETNHPARRQRHGDRPTEPLVFEDAAANKAAEEGGLPTPRAIMDVVDEFGSGTSCYTVEDMRQAIEADRASRKVANKAEVDDHYQGIEQALEMNDNLRLYGTIDKPATPPATAGASTAPANASPVSEREISELRKLVGHGGVYAAEFADTEQLMACFWSIIGQINKQLERKPFGASTVLTDERGAFDKWFADNKFGGMKDSMWAAWEARSEVAAQAGQVAVPDDMTAAADFIDKRAEQYLQDHADTEWDTGSIVFHKGEAGREYHSVLVELADDLRQASKPTACAVPPAGWNCTRAGGHEGPCAAAPSPAKESK